MGEGADESAEFIAAVAATEPARWLLATGLEGAALTQTHTLSLELIGVHERGSENKACLLYTSPSPRD